MSSPTARSLRLLRQRGYLAGVVERWNPGARVRQDLFGFIDIVAVTNDGTGPLAVQTTSATNLASRVTKVLSDAMAEPVNRWLLSGGRIECHGWSKRGPRGKRKTWQVTVTPIPSRDMAAFVEAFNGAATLAPQERP